MQRSNQYKSESIMSSSSQSVIVISPVETEIEIQPVAVPEEKMKKVRVLKADKADKKADKKADNKADKKAEKNAEKKVKVSKKKNAQEKATNEVVQMVQEMKTAFIKEEDTANVEEEPELVVDMYIGESEPQDSVVDFDALLLDEDETPMTEMSATIEQEPAKAEKAEEKEEEKEEEKQEEKATVVNPIPDPEPEPKEVVRPVFRHEFSAECFTLLKEFARTNVQLPRKAYKQAWEQFTDANAEFISQETARLADAGYTGDVLVKMFKTAKYYLTKREKKSEANNVAAVAADAGGDAASNDDDATVSTPSSPLHKQSQVHLSSSSSSRRRSYIALDREVLRAMDAHISTATSGTGSKPSVCYTAFCEQFRELIEVEVARLARLETATFSEKDAQDKLKKTYKNRMFCALTAHVAANVAVEAV
jgi:hypothetical protein